MSLSPNPVYHNAKLIYSLSGNGRVNIVVYSAKGQRIKLLFTAMQNAGTYTYDMNGELNNISADTYFIKIEQNGKMNTIPFVKH